MRVLTVLVYFISIEIILLIIAKVALDSMEKRIRRVRYFKLGEKIRKKGGVLFVFIGILVIYAPVISLLLETIGKNPKEPLVDVAYSTLGITLVAIILILISYSYYKRIVLPKKREELTKTVRSWLSKA